MTYLDKLESILHENLWLDEIFLNHFKLLSVFSVEIAALLLPADDTTLLKVISTLRILQTLLAVETATISHESSIFDYKKHLTVSLILS